MSAAVAWPRRRFLLGSGALAVAPSVGYAAPEPSIEEAFWAGFPLFEVARTAYASAGPSAERTRDRFNQMVHRRDTTDHTNRMITAINNDVLISWSRIDLSNGPLVLSIPSVNDRYYSVILLDAFTDNFFFAGTRATRGSGGVWTLVGPSSRRRSTRSGSAVVRCPTDDVWLIARILLKGPGDRAAVHAVQDQIALEPVDGATRPAWKPLPVAPADVRDPGNFLAVANAMLARADPADRRVRRAARFRALGLRHGNPGAFSELPVTRQSAWREAIPNAIETLKRGTETMQRVVDGWSYSAEQTGDFGDNDQLRAAVALAGLAALPPEEAMYAHAVTDADGEPLHGDRRYALDLPAGGPPVDAFWSVTMYQLEEDGRLFLADNPLRRYSIGDRTPGLQRRADGGLSLLLQNEAPSQRELSNWLPAPPGPFRPAFRFYLPRPQLRRLEWVLPPVRKIQS